MSSKARGTHVSPGIYSKIKEQKLYTRPRPKVNSLQKGVVVNSINTTGNTETDDSYVMVDLGLPSGLKWSDRNIGAINPEDGGLFFQWGDTIGYTIEQAGVDKIFDSSTYFDVETIWASSYIKYDMNKKTVLDIEDDAAMVYMGDSWKIPSVNEFKELLDNTRQVYIDIDGNEVDVMPKSIKGVKLVSNINGESIFFPTPGIFERSTFNNGDKIGYVNDEGVYWTSELANDKSAYVAFLSSRMGIPFTVGGSYLSRFNGHTIRGVYKK